jgi:NTE family protein
MSKTAFVLSGGASLGAVQVGMLEALAGQGVRPDLLVGTSVGALNAAWVAGHPEPDSLAELAGICRSLRSGVVFPLRPAAALRGLLARVNHLSDSAQLGALLRDRLGYSSFEEARVPLHVTATELMTGRPRLLSRGPLLPALLASCAIPGVYAPVRVGGADLVDGGVSANTPVSHAVDLGADTVYVLPSGYACALARPPAGIVGMVLHSLTLLLQQQLIYDVERNLDRADVHVLPPLCPLDVYPTDFSRSEELISRARTSARRWLRSKRSGDAGVLAFHGAHRRRS